MFNSFRMISESELMLEPNTNSYTALITACAGSRRLPEAEAVFGEMKRQRITPGKRFHVSLSSVI